MRAPLDPARRRTTTRHVAALVACVTLGVPVLAGCGVRLETPPPTEPSPGAVEQVRARTVDDALQLAADAQSARAGAPEAVATVLDDVASFSEQHVEQLGGVYDSGLPDPSGSPTATPTPTTVATVEAVVAGLDAAATTAAQDADDVADGDLARLVASVAVARDELEARLTTAAGLPVPAPPAQDAPTPEPTPTPSVSAGGGQAVAAADLDTLALAHDQAGFGLEVVAAKLSGDQRAAAQTAAARHRAAGDAWAVAAASAGTASDPRRASYALPAGLDDPNQAVALARQLETSVADAYATVVARAPAGDRTDLVDGLRDATAAARGWGAAPVALPGLPERAAAPTG